jgi:16S rRNA (uracil1498-N3)-methyltransferase
MARFYVPDLPGPRPGEADLVALDDEQSHHARRVLRLREGDEVELFNGAGLVARGRVEAGAAQPGRGARVLVRVLEARLVEADRPRVEIAAAIPKGPRAQDMVEQLSQAGADRLIPLLTERSVVDPRPGKVERFGRIAIESAKQCGRAHVLIVEPPASLEQVLRRQCDVRLLASPGADAALEVRGVAAAASVLVLIGPEGGWTDAERDQAMRAGCRGWSLGPHVMRIETAAVVAAALVRYVVPTSGPSRTQVRLSPLTPDS